MPGNGRVSKRMSLRALSRRLGVASHTVQKAVKSGRLRKSIGHDRRGRPFVADPKLAKVEWKSGSGRIPNNGKAGADRPAAAPEHAAAAGPELEDDDGAPTLVAAQVRVATERARGLELSNRLKQGELLDAGVVVREQFELARMVRDAVLNVPNRIAAELAGETDPKRVHERMYAELQRTLAGLAEFLQRG